ncbi:MAG: hypothetical protein HOF21_09155 [Nitrospina sp.]|jgi:hypothetical protein|nr:hypothetical protein [Nitrospina sp.]MBT5632844.1 hypothetical protein [Nitrospina sp.]
MKCPKCGSEQIESESCVNCGVIFENYFRSQKKSSQNIPPPVVSAPESQGNKGSVKMDLNSLHGIALGTVSVLGAIKAIFLELSLVSSMILIPFYFSFVPVVSAFWGDAFYMYWRWEGKFIPYEGRWRTPLIIFFMISSIVFAVMFFKLDR